MGNMGDLPLLKTSNFNVYTPFSPTSCSLHPEPGRPPYAQENPPPPPPGPHDEEARLSTPPPLETEETADICFSGPTSPHSGHGVFDASSLILWKSSKILPHFLHLYSYKGIKTSLSTFLLFSPIHYRRSVINHFGIRLKGYGVKPAHPTP